MNLDELRRNAPEGAKYWHESGFYQRIGDMWRHWCVDKWHPTNVTPQTYANFISLGGDKSLLVPGQVCELQRSDSDRPRWKWAEIIAVGNQIAIYQDASGAEHPAVIAEIELRKLISPRDRFIQDSSKAFFGVDQMVPNDIAFGAIWDAMCRGEIKPPEPMKASGTWCREKPTRPGVFRIRSWHVGDLDREAVVQVARYNGELVCNIHDTVTDNPSEFSMRMENVSDIFEWTELANDQQR